MASVFEFSATLLAFCASLALLALVYWFFCLRALKLKYAKNKVLNMEKIAAIDKGPKPEATDRVETERELIEKQDP